MNIDSYLTLPYITSLLSTKDAKSFNGLIRTIKNHYFLTNGQGEFLLNVLENNKELLIHIIPEILEDLKSPTWSKPFRQIEIIRKMYITTDNDIKIESNYSNEFRNFMSRLCTTLDYKEVTPGKLYISDLTEECIVNLVPKLLLLNFDISDDLLKYYDIITSWDGQDILNNFNIKNITNEETRQLIINDIGADTPTDSLIVNDRRMRYQYHNDSGYNTELSAGHLTLIKLIANRSNTKVWVDNSKYSLTDIIKTLTDLKRFPILITFNKHNNITTTEQLQQVSTALENNNITDNIGVYLRLNNTVDGSKFNQIIADKKYNAMLDTDTQVACVDIAAIPKFFLSSQWAPMAVISIGHSLRNSRTAIYARQCDLLITYSPTKPLIVSKPV